MNYLKNLGISFLYIIGIIFIFTLFITLLSYFNIFSDKTTNIFLLIITIIAMMIGGIILGRKTNKKGWLEGLKLGLIITIIFILFGFLGLKFNYKLSNFIYYLILTVSSIFGSMLGINKRKTN